MILCLHWHYILHNSFPNAFKFNGKLKILLTSHVVDQTVIILRMTFSHEQFCEFTSENKQNKEIETNLFDAK